MVVDGHKACNTCKANLPVAAFYRANKGDGYAYTCKDCMRIRNRERYQANPEKGRARAARWRAENPERAKEIGRNHYWRDPERGRRQAQEWRARNPEKVVAQRRAWYVAYDGRERHAEYRAANPLAAKARNSRANWKRRHRAAARLRAVTPEVIALLLASPCSYCGGPSDTVDHIVPLASGGTSDWDNLAPACKSCNSGKRDKDLLSFLLYRKVVTTYGR